MTVEAVLVIFGLVSTGIGVLWVLLRKDIIREVDNKIGNAMSKIKDDKIKELIDDLLQERHKNDYLKEKIKDLK